MPKPGLPIIASHALWILALIVFASLSTASADARNPNLTKYPLRVHVLVAGDAQRQGRMSASGSAACDGIDDMLSAGDESGGPVSFIGLGGDPCSLNAGPMASQLQYVQSEQSYAGQGRGDLVSPPNGTLGISFQYKDCYRVRAQPGFQSLPARWKKSGQLEVLIPSDSIPVAGRPMPVAKCSFTVTKHEFVYLLIPPGRLIEVSPDIYWAKPALRVYLSGGTQAVQRRTQTVPVSALAAH